MSDNFGSRLVLISAGVLALTVFMIVLASVAPDYLPDKSNGRTGEALTTTEVSIGKDAVVPEVATAVDEHETVVATVEGKISVDLKIKVTLFMQRITDDGWEMALVNDGEKLKSHDNIKVSVETSGDCYAYLVLFGSMGRAQLIFPSPDVPLENKLNGLRPHLIPPADDWFWLDENPGVETLYAMASEKPLTDIYAILDEMERMGRLAAEGTGTGIVEEPLDVATAEMEPESTDVDLEITPAIIDKVTETVRKSVPAIDKITFIHE